MTRLPELGQLCLILSLLISLGQAIFPTIGCRRGWADWSAVARSATLIHLSLMIIAPVILGYALVTNDLSVRYVADNAHPNLPIWYRCAAIWGGNQGSLLFCNTILAGWAALAARHGRLFLSSTLTARLLSIFGALSAGLLAVVLWTANPFIRLDPAPLQGHDLNPLLQDPGLVIHPPLLYGGYLGFSLPFALTIACLLEKQSSQEALRLHRQWTLIAWSLLTAGIGFGSWWAYRVLGWGGWWFWDPVENASLLPWLTGTALMHSQIATQRRHCFTYWTIYLSLATFLLALMGIFLVRSGALISVHAFTDDPARGVGLLLLWFVTGCTAVGLAVWRSSMLAISLPDTDVPFAVCSRETSLLLNHVFLLGTAAMVLLGTLYPVLMDALHQDPVSVGAPYFATLFLTLMAPVIVLLPVGPVLSWQQASVRRTGEILAPSIVMTGCAIVLTRYCLDLRQVKGLLGVAAACWVIAGTAQAIWRAWRRSARFGRAAIGAALAHVGVGIFCAGALLVESLGSEHEAALRPGTSMALHTYQLRLEQVRRQPGPNYWSEQAQMTLIHQQHAIATLYPQRRHFTTTPVTLSQASIHVGALSDVYVRLGAPLGAQQWVVHAYYRPFIRWIWLGSIILAIGGGLAASERRPSSVAGLPS